MIRHLSVLGSSGSIGRQTLEVAEACGHQVSALSVHRNAALAEEQARKFHPKLVAAADETAARDLRIRLADTSVRVSGGPEALLEAASFEEADTVVTAVVGISGLKPTLAAVDAGKRIALANKETLVCAGDLVLQRAREKKTDIVPVDSEHSAVFQCLQGSRDPGEIRRLILTASGGPFYGKKRSELESVTVEQALNHPNWSMGAKITVDSATMMNKGLELIEAMRLYGMPPERISIVIHRQSLIHSMVEFVDGAILAQLGTADMRLPIQYALSWPDREKGPAAPLDLLSCPPLTFQAPDLDTFRCLRLARHCAETGGNSTAVLNGANEAAVGLFLSGRIGFLDIDRLVEQAVCRVPFVAHPDLDEIFESDRLARECVRSNLR